MQNTPFRFQTVLLASAAALLAAGVVVDAQRGGGRGGAPPRPPREAAHFDLTGYWSAIVTEDWRVRMTTPPKGDYQGVPLNAAGRKVADAWDPAKETGQGEAFCKAYGAPGLLRVPTRLHITWVDDATLQLATDAGSQTRTFRFAAPGSAAAAAPAAAAPSLQGTSVATWFKQPQSKGFGPAPSEGPGTLRVLTTGLLAGHLRKNGVPYSDRTTLTEYYQRHSDFGSEWMTVLTIVEDPEYLARSFITSTHFKREHDGSGFKPRPCEVAPPLK